MARLGTFDTQLEPRAWFGDNALPEGWFVADLIPAPASNAFTLVADGGTYSYSGNDANLVYGTAGSFTLSADGATYSYSGNDAALRFNRILAADGGTYSYTGNNANLRVNRSLAAEGGSYTYSGNNADLLYSGGPPPPPVGVDIYFIELRSFTERRRI